jgi:hypothetical protein
MAITPDTVLNPTCRQAYSPVLSAPQTLEKLRHAERACDQIFATTLRNGSARILAKVLTFYPHERVEEHGCPRKLPQCVKKVAESPRTDYIALGILLAPSRQRRVA